MSLFDGDAGAAATGDVVVLHQPARVVAHEHADALGVVHLIVQDVAARVGALDDDAMPGGGGDATLLENQHRTALHAHRARHRRAVC